jgi:glycosyltransferase involved in cell wall biosynthesis
VSGAAFTVVLAAYNEEDYVGDAIGSVLAQTRRDFELFVVDDGSADSTAEVARGFESDPRLTLISQENRGLAASLNRGIRAGSAPYASLIDADDLWMPTYLEELGAALDQHPEAGFAYTDAWWYDVARGRFWKRTISEYLGAPGDPPTDPEQFLRLLMKANFVFGLTTIRRAAFEAVGGFNEALRACEDYELWIRLLASGYPAAHVKGRLAIQRDRRDSMSSNLRSMLTNVREACRITAEELPVSDAVKELAGRRMAEMDHGLATLDGQARTTAAWWALREKLIRIRQVLLAKRFFWPGTPPEVAAAFPQFGQRRG